MLLVCFDKLIGALIFINLFRGNRRGSGPQNGLGNTFDDRDLSSKVQKMNGIRELCKCLGIFFDILIIDLKRRRAVLDANRVAHVGKPFHNFSKSFFFQAQLS